MRISRGSYSPASTAGDQIVAGHARDGSKKGQKCCHDYGLDDEIFMTQHLPPAILWRTESRPAEGLAYQTTASVALQRLLPLGRFATSMIPFSRDVLPRLRHSRPRAGRDLLTASTPKPEAVIHASLSACCSSSICCVCIKMVAIFAASSW